MARFSTDYAGAVVDQLGVNYRSTEQVVHAFTAVAPHMGASPGMLPLPLEADRSAGPGKPEIRRFENPSEEAPGGAARIRGVQAGGGGLRGPGVQVGRDD